VLKAIMTKSATKPKLLPDPEVEARPRRRTYTGEYKAQILAECDAATEPGAIGAILRREGLYSSHLVDWRRRRADGGVAGLAPKKTGRPPKSNAQRAAEKELARVKREKAQLLEKLRRADIIIDAQKKLASVLESLRSPTETSGSDE
jgi:transposase-like protein